MRESLRGSSGVVSISDDILVKGDTIAEHNANLLASILRLKENGFTVNYPKCIIRTQSLNFHGHMISKDGISADPQKLDVIREAPPPQTPAEVRSLLGMGNYVSRFIRNFATMVEPLRELTKSDVDWFWGPPQERALQRLKDAMTSITVMSYFDPSMQTEVSVDASPVGLGAILAQRKYDISETHVVAYASRALTPVETRYSQIETESLAIVWSFERLNLYLLGSEFKLPSDHKPLELIFNNAKLRPSARIERWTLCLQPYDFTVVHIAGKTNPAAYMSRHPTKMQVHSREETAAETYINFVTHETTSITLNEISTATLTATVLQLAISAAHTCHHVTEYTSIDFKVLPE